MWINHNISYIKFRNRNHKICDIIKFILKYKILNKLKLNFFLLKIIIITYLKKYKINNLKNFMFYLKFLIFNKKIETKYNQFIPKKST